MMIGFNGGLIGNSRDPDLVESLPGIWTLDEQLKARRNNLWPVLIYPDPYYGNVSLLLRGSLTTQGILLDVSPNPKTFTLVGNVGISTLQFKYGGSSVSFDGVGDRITTGSNIDFAFGTGDFTVEGWVWENTRTSYASILEIGNHASSNGILFHTNGGGNLNGFVGTYSGAWYGSITSPPLSTWNHIAWVRKSGALVIYVNGTASNSVVFTNNLTNSSLTSVGSVASYSSGGSNYDFNGNIDDLRITKGIARYEIGSGANAGKMVFTGTNTLVHPLGPI